MLQKEETVNSCSTAGDIIQLYCNLIFNGNCGKKQSLRPSIGHLVLPHHITHMWWWTSHRWIWCGDYLSVLKATCYNLSNNLSKTMIIYSNKRLFHQWNCIGCVWMCDPSHPLCLTLVIKQLCCKAFKVWANTLNLSPGHSHYYNPVT